MFSSLSRPASLSSINTPISLFACEAVVQLQDPMMARLSANTILAWDIAVPLQLRPTAAYSWA
eukprot:14687658-Alexandrium_andersonii.AAC.1